MTLAYSSLVNSAKHDTVFIHGNLASSVWWEPTLNEWKKQGSLGSGDLICADWRGCGKNPDWHNDRKFTIKDLASDYLELLNTLGKAQVAVVGHSLGGLIALQMMALEPQRVCKAVLLDPVGASGVVFDDSMYEAFRQMALSRELTQTVILSTIREQSLITAEFKERLSADAFKAVKGIGSSVLEILKTVDLTSEAAGIQVPTLILHGQHDQIIPLKDSEELKRTMPNATLEVLPESGHCWNIENPAAFVKRIRAWI